MSDTDASEAATPVDDPFAPLRTELDRLETEAVDDTLDDLDLRSTADLVSAMNAENSRVPDAVRAASPEIARAVDAITERMRRGGRLIYMGAGTSGRLGVLDASECPPTFGVDPARVVGVIAGGDRALRNSVESAEDSPSAGRADVDDMSVSPDDTVVGITASGRTPYVVGALQRAGERNALTVALSCNADSRVGRLADIAIEVVVGAEFIAGSTRLKSGSAEKLVLNMLSTLVMVRLGKTYGNIMVDMRASNDKLNARAERAVMALTGRGEPDVRAALTASGGSVKTSVLMLLSHTSPAEARMRLDTAHGSLRAALAAHRAGEGSGTAGSTAR